MRKLPSTEHTLGRRSWRRGIEGLVPAGIIVARVPPGVLARGWSFFHRGPEEALAVAAAEQEDEHREAKCRVKWRGS